MNKYYNNILHLYINLTLYNIKQYFSTLVHKKINLPAFLSILLNYWLTFKLIQAMAKKML